MSFQRHCVWSTLKVSAEIIHLMSSYSGQLNKCQVHIFPLGHRHSHIKPKWHMTSRYITFVQPQYALSPYITIRPNTDICCQ